MNNDIHIFDLDTLCEINNKAWIVDKNNPSVPIMKISEADFNLIQSGIYKHQNNNIDFNGKTFWLSDNMLNSLKVKVKKFNNVTLSNLAISMQEFLNKDLIDKLDFRIKMENISHLKHKTDVSIYIVTSKIFKDKHQNFISKMEKKLNDNGIKICNYYFIGETFYNQDTEMINFRKLIICLQHLTGFKIVNNKFIDDDVVEQSNNVNFYDSNIENINYVRSVQTTLDKFLLNTEHSLVSKINTILKGDDYVLTTLLSTDNNVNKFKKEQILLKVANIISTYENFRIMLGK